MAVSDYSTTPANNVAISAISIDEGCDAGNLNDAFRQLMADVRVMFDNLPSVAGYMPTSGGTFSGTQPIYTGRGAYAHWNSASLASNREFMQASGGATPTGMVAGDKLYEY